MVYNLTGFNTGNTFFDYATTINTALGGHFATVFMFIMFILLLIVFKSYDTRAGLIASSTITTLFAILFWGIGWVGFAHIFIPAALLFTGLIWKALSN